jgi:hypothetical protein
MATRTITLARRFARDRHDGHYIERRIYPAGFERAGGVRLPLEQREAALRQIEETTRGADPANAFVTIQKIVREKWDELAPQPGDVTQLSYGTGPIAYQDPDMQEKARQMLLWIPTTPQFAGVFDAIEATTWSMTFSGDATQTTIAAATGKKSQGAVSKALNRSVWKLNARYRELRERDELPLEIAVWVRQIAEDDTRRHDPDLADATARLRKRDWMLQARKRDVGPIAAEHAKTGDRALDELSIRHG